MKEKGSFLLSVSWCPKRVIREKSKTQICPCVGKEPKLIQSAQFYNTKLKSLWLGADVRCRGMKFSEDEFAIKKKITKLMSIQTTILRGLMQKNKQCQSLGGQ